MVGTQQKPSPILAWTPWLHPTFSANIQSYRSLQEAFWTHTIKTRKLFIVHYTIAQNRTKSWLAQLHVRIVF
ncbi:MAG: hypothetical protein LUO89_14935, partial [Methanothrix sp.]|nr:hypothetical protein [Methanothrix sp.]